MAHSAVGKQTPLSVATSAPTAYWVIE